jgi:hypothetical protein
MRERVELREGEATVVVDERDLVGPDGRLRGDTVLEGHAAVPQAP